MPIYWDCDIVVAETGGEASGASHEYATYFSELYKKTGVVFKTKRVVLLRHGKHEEI